MFYFRAGSTVGGMVNVSVLRNGKVMRYFPVASNSAIHVPLAIVEELPAGTQIEIVAAGEGSGTLDPGYRLSRSLGREAVAHFRDNSRQIVVEPIYRRQGLKIERVRRFDETVLLPIAKTGHSWSFHITLNGTRYVRHGDRSYTLAPSTIFWTSPLGEPVTNICDLPAPARTPSELTFPAQRWRLFVRTAAGLQRTGMPAMLALFPQQPILSLQLATPQILHVLRRLLAATEQVMRPRWSSTITSHCS